jgi:hypothetical protein
LRQLNEDELSDISFDDLAENECENDDCDSESNDGEDEIWKDTFKHQLSRQELDQPSNSSSVELVSNINSVIV